MNMQKGKLLIFCTVIILMNTVYADAPNITVSTSFSSQKKEVISSSQKTDLLLYLNQVLTEAGFPDATRKYLIDLARPQLTNINPLDLADKTRSLKRNLYIFFNAMSQKCQSPAASDEVRKQYYLADLNPEPWNNILSPKILARFKAQHVFDDLSVQDIKNCGFTFCQVWPFCEN